MTSEVSTLVERLAERGLDVAAPVRAPTHRWRQWNVSVSTEHEDAEALVVGNSRELWPRFLERLAAEPELQRSPDPLDLAVRHMVCEALAAVPSLGHCRALWPQVGPPFIAIGRIAESAGLLYSTPVGLWIHPEHGLWCALRAVILLPESPLRELGDEPPAFPPSPCLGCERPCVVAQATTLGRDVSQMKQDPAAWIAIRDACPVGRDRRYDEAQVLYHYTRDPRHLPLAAGRKGA